MEIRWYKPIFLLLFVLTLVGSAIASGQNLQIISSSESGFHFVLSFDERGSGLQRRINADSSTTPYATLQVAVPAGSRARLLSAGAGSESSTASQVVVEVSEPFVVRGRSIVSLKVLPVTASGSASQVEINLAFDRTRRTAALSAANDPGFERVFGASLANFEQARLWPVLQRRGSQALSSADAKDLLSDADQWYQVAVKSTGLYEITGSRLQSAGVSLAGLSIDSLRMFNAGGLPNAANTLDDRPEFREAALLVLDQDGDGFFDTGDRVIFYGEAVDRWLYRAGYPRSFMNNRYTDENVYWLAVSGDFGTPPVRMGQIDGSPTGVYDTLITTFWRDVHVEQENLISRETDGHVMDFYNWFWTDSTNLTLYVPTPGAISGDSAAVYLEGRTSGSSSTDGYIDMAVNGTAGVDKACSYSSCRYDTYSLLGGAGELNRVDLQLTLSS
ncbi:MAG: hypothetical protein GY867_04485, partial [bacterium]|nr:hypothetical protein [bacterium]